MQEGQHTLKFKGGYQVPGSLHKHLKGKGGKLNTNQAEPVAANSTAVGQFLSISCNLMILAYGISKSISCHFSIIDHPNYGSCCNFDFSLLRMRNGFDLPSISNVAPACLPTIAKPENVDVTIRYVIVVTMHHNLQLTFLQVLISGWGSLSSGGSYPSRLQKV